jgi:hypothetical protein
MAHRSVNVGARWQDSLLFATTLLLFGAISVIRGADANWDLRNYHYYNAYALWTGRLGFDYAPAQIQTFLNPAIDLPFFLLIGAVPPIAYGFIVGALHGTNIWLAFRLALRIIGSGSRTLALGLAIAGIGVGTFAELGTSFHDLTLAPLVLGALLLLLGRQRGDKRPGSAAVLTAGVLLGLAVGFKYTFAIFAPGMAVVAATVALRGWRCRVGAVMLLAIGMAAGFVVVAGPWMLYLWSAYRNPFGAYFNGVFQSPYFEPWSFEDKRFLPKTTLQTVAYPFFFFLSRHKTVWEAAFREARFAALYVGVTAVAAKALKDVIASGRWRSALGRGSTRVSRVDLALLAFTIVTYVVWQIQFSIYRYLIPLELLAPLVMYILLSRLVEPMRPRRIVLVLALVGVFLCMRAPGGGRIPWHREYFGTRVAAAAVPPTSLMLVGSREPLAFVVAALPPSVRVVRIQSNMFRPELRTRFAAEIRDVIGSHRGPIRLLSHAARRAEAEQGVAAYGLHIAPETCAPVVNNMDSGIEICVVER